MWRRQPSRSIRQGGAERDPVQFGRCASGSPSQFLLACLPFTYHNQPILKRQTSRLSREVCVQMRVGALDGLIVPETPSNFRPAFVLCPRRDSNSEPSDPKICGMGLHCVYSVYLNGER
jgi:hypothetical protein